MLSGVSNIFCFPVDFFPTRFDGNSIEGFSFVIADGPFIWNDLFRELPGPREDSLLFWLTNDACFIDWLCLVGFFCWIR